jgi:hypothetical protein
MKACYVNVYERKKGDQLVGGSCWATRKAADAMAGRATQFRRVFVLRITPKQVDIKVARKR